MNEALIDSELSRLNQEQATAVQSLTTGWQGEKGEFRVTIMEGPPGTGME